MGNAHSFQKNLKSNGFKGKGHVSGSRSSIWILLRPVNTNILSSTLMNYNGEHLWK